MKYAFVCLRDQCKSHGSQIHKYWNNFSFEKYANMHLRCDASLNIHKYCNIYGYRCTLIYTDGYPVFIKTNIRPFIRYSS